MSNTLKAFNLLCDTVIEEFDENYNVSNRVNQVGDALEKFVKDLYADSIGNKDYMSLHQKVFSYLGNKNNPPDAILKNSDAIEIKKVETLNGDIALNSSFPKDYFYKDDPLITNSCKNCEEDSLLEPDKQWTKKDMLYVVGFVKNKILRGIWFVYGDCYAADREVYQTIKNTITNGIKQLDLDLLKTNEIAKVNKVDPLEITNLRVRGMWSIQHPAKVFSHLGLDTSSSFFAHLIMSKRKYDSFPKTDLNSLNQTIKDNLAVSKLEAKIFNPNNPAKNIDAVVFSLKR
ncbi:NgoPII family restriction endonuclease [Acinetobacter dispersus]|uniref:NgoPII family restriction endonuclease n=1 Tax=Acinetobacter dispersus TaxID=70348 RepID=UPI003C300510